MSSTVVKHIKHTPEWRRTLAISILVVGILTLVFQDPDVHPLISLLLIVFAIAIFLPKEYFTVTYDPNIHTLTLEYRGKHVTVPTENVTFMTFEFDGHECVIVLKYADGTTRSIWEGPRLGNVAEVIREMLDIDYEIRTY